jgi:hypothetical protein
MANTLHVLSFVRYCDDFFMITLTQKFYYFPVNHILKLYFTMKLSSPSYVNAQMSSNVYRSHISNLKNNDARLLLFTILTQRKSRGSAIQ